VGSEIHIGLVFNGVKERGAQPQELHFLKEKEDKVIIIEL